MLTANTGRPRISAVSGISFSKHRAHVGRLPEWQVLGSSAGPSVQTRKGIAADVLQIMQGRKLQDDERDRKIRQQLRRLPAAPGPCPQWQQLADHVSAWGPAALHSALDRRLVPVPNVEGAQQVSCLLTSSQNARRFRNRHLNEWLAELFLSVPASMQAVSLPKVALSRFDLFHAHLFCERTSNQLGMLFHAHEYPAMGPDFKINLGFCQRGSNLEFNAHAMDFRNLIWFEGELCALDVGQGILHEELIMDGLQDVRTVLESDFGAATVDINFFASIRARHAGHKIFVCPAAP